MTATNNEAIDALAHVSVQPREPHLARLRAVSDRFDSRYSMAMAILAKQEALDPTQHFHALRTLHHERVIDMLNKGVSWEAIKTGDLDSPTTPDFEWRLRVKLALNRRGDAQRAVITKRRKTHADSK